MESMIRTSRRKLRNLVFGILAGYLLAVITLDKIIHFEEESGSSSQTPLKLRQSQSTIPPKTSHSLFRNISQSIVTMSLTIRQDPITIAEKLKDKVRILCWILTSPKTHLKKALHVKNTWGKHCNVLLFMSTEEDPVIDSIALNISDGRKYLWWKTKDAMKYVHDNYLDQADWFYKADDDTFAIMENMRYFLKDENPRNSIYFGCRFRPFVRQGYMSGGAGYVMSRAAVERFNKFGLGSSLGNLCSRTSATGAEDVQLGKCMQAIGVKAGDSIDSSGEHRFLPFRPEFHLIMRPSATKWFYHYIYSPYYTGFNCCSDSAISFHYIRNDKMYSLYYLVYTLKHPNRRTFAKHAAGGNGFRLEQKNTTKPLLSRLRSN